MPTQLIILQRARPSVTVRFITTCDSLRMLFVFEWMMCAPVCVCVCVCVCVSQLSVYSLVENIITPEYMKVINKNVITLLERSSFTFMFMVLLNCISDLGSPHWNIWSGLLETPVSRKSNAVQQQHYLRPPK